MIPGTVVALGGEEFVVPPLSLMQVSAFLPRIRQIASLDPTQMGDAQLKTLIEVVTAALQRNYPELTKEKVEDILDLGNALPVLNAILGGNKLPAMEPKPIDDHAAVGELSGFQGNEPAALAEPPAASGPALPFEPHYPWRPNPPVVGS
jgi:hypothetical protein